MSAWMAANGVHDPVSLSRCPRCRDELDSASKLQESLGTFAVVAGKGRWLTLEKKRAYRRVNEVRMLLTQLLKPDELAQLNDRQLDILEDSIERDLVTNKKIHELLRKGVEKNARVFGKIERAGTVRKVTRKKT